MTQTIFRANNPCAIRPLGRGKWNGETGIVRVGNGEFSAFRNMTYGVRAGLRCLDTYRTKHRLYTPRQIISRWAPPSDNNPTTSYAEFIAARCGVGIDDPIPFDYRHTRLLVEAIMDFELKGSLMPPKTAVDEAFRMMAAEEAAEIGGYPDPYSKGPLDVLRRQPQQRPRATGWIEGLLATLGTLFATGTDWLWSIGIYPREALRWLTEAAQGFSFDRAALLVVFVAFVFLAWLIWSRKDASHVADHPRSDPHPPSDVIDWTGLPDGAVGGARGRGDAESTIGLPTGGGSVADSAGRVHRRRNLDGREGTGRSGSLFERFPTFTAGDGG